MKNKKNWFKLLLDTAMVVVLALLYRKQAISLAFHEIAGLALMGVFIIHILLNGKWVGATVRRLFARTTPGKARLLCIVDTALLVCFALIGISGAMISKIVFSFNAGGSWKAIHYFCAALSILLMGVHLGLHSTWIGGMLKKLLHLSPRASRAVVSVLTLVICVFGVWNFCTTSFAQWISMPFSSQSGQMERGMDFSQQMPTAATSDIAASGTAVSDSTAQTTGAGQGLGPQNGQGQGFGAQNGHGSEGGQGSFAGALTVFAQFFSMTYLVATATALISKAVGAKKYRRA